MITALALLLQLGAAQDAPPPPLDPDEPAPVAPVAPVEPDAPTAPVDPVEPVDPAAPTAPPVPTSAPDEPARSRVLEDPIARCKGMLLDEDTRPTNAAERDARLAAVERCLRERAAVPAPEGDAEAADQIARASAMADVVAAWRLVPPPATLAAPADATGAVDATGPTGTGTDVSALQTLSVSGLVESGRAEALLHGAAAGATGSFVLAATIFSTTRESEQATLPWLIAAPGVGAVAGAAGAWALVEVAGPTPGDIAFASSTMWTGAAQGFLLQLAVFDGNQEVSSVPLRFLTVLGGGAAGLAAGVGLAPFVDVTQGDAGVANSAALWGGVMTAFGVGYLNASGSNIGLSQTSFLLVAGSTVPYVAVLAAHEYLVIERWPSWLIEAGGAGGFLVSGAFIAFLGSSGSLNQQAAVGLLGAGTLAGVVAGTASAWIVSTSMQPSGTVDTAPVAFAPTLFSDGARAQTMFPGFVVGGRF